MMKATTAQTLTEANQNSASPKLLAEKKLMQNITPRNKALQIHPGTSANQYCMMICAATKSTATAIAQL